MAGLAKEFGVSTTNIRKTVRRGVPGDEEATKVPVSGASIAKFAKRAKSILWRQNGKDKKTYNTWQERVNDLTDNGGCTRHQAIVQVSKDYKCLERLFAEYDVSAHDPNPDSHPQIRQHGQPEPVDGVMSEARVQSHRENLAWAIDMAGRYLRTGEKPDTTPNDAAYFMYRQAIDDPKEFFAKYTQIQAKPNEEEEADRLARTTGKRAISEIDQMLDVLEEHGEAV